MKFAIPYIYFKITKWARRSVEFVFETMFYQEAML